MIAVAGLMALARLGSGGAALMLLVGSCQPPSRGAGAAGAAPVAAAPLPVVAAPAAPAPAPAAAPAPVLGLTGVRQQGAVLRGQAPAGTAAVMLGDVVVPVAADGAFVVGLDRDAPANLRLTARLADGRELAEDLVVAPGNWRIQNIDAPMRGAASSDADFARRRPAELARINAARRTKVDSGGWRQQFIWPATGRISGVFGSQRVYRGQPGSYHSGVDIARPTGTPFVAPADGVVVLAAREPFTLEGRLLIVDHGMGLSSAFLHCDRLDVAVGDRVVQGQPLGTIGSTGRSTGPHLHWGMRWGAARIDAARLAGPMPPGNKL